MTFSTVSTVCVTGAGVGVDNAWEQKKLEARKLLENRAESPASSACFVRQVLPSNYVLRLKSNFLQSTKLAKENKTEQNLRHKNKQQKCTFHMLQFFAEKADLTSCKSLETTAETQSSRGLRTSTRPPCLCGENIFSLMQEVYCAKFTNLRNQKRIFLEKLLAKNQLLTDG